MSIISKDVAELVTGEDDNTLPGNIVRRNSALSLTKGSTIVLMYTR